MFYPELHPLLMTLMTYNPNHWTDIRSQDNSYHDSVSTSRIKYLSKSLCPWVRANAKTWNTSKSQLRKQSSSMMCEQCIEKCTHCSRTVRLHKVVLCTDSTCRRMVRQEIVTGGSCSECVQARKAQEKDAVAGGTLNQWCVKHGKPHALYVVLSFRHRNLEMGASLWILIRGNERLQAAIRRRRISLRFMLWHLEKAWMIFESEMIMRNNQGKKNF